MINTHQEILVVDDDPAFRILIYKKLKALGYPTFLAQNGEEAVVSLWEKQSIELVLLDVCLPVINRLNVFQIIRKDFPDKKLIICSALPKTKQQALINDVDDYYCKDDDLDSLVAKVGQIIGNKNRIKAVRENEKRNFRRIPVNIFASCERLNTHRFPSCVHFFSHAKDLSLQGGRFIIPEDILTGQHFSAALELPANFLPVLVDCEVMWVRLLEDDDFGDRKNYEVGVRFVKLDLPQDEEKLKTYLSFA